MNKIKKRKKNMDFVKREYRKSVFGEQPESEKALEFEQVITPRFVLDFEDLDFYEEIGHGAYSTIFKGLRRSTNQIVAIKQLRIAVLSENYESVFQSESSLLGSLSHKNIVSFIGVLTFPGKKFLFIYFFIFFIFIFYFFYFYFLFIFNFFFDDFLF